jgi:hypothetical protein
MEEFAELIQFLSECEFKKENKHPILNCITLWLFSANAGYVTGQAVYYIFDGWFW